MILMPELFDFDRLCGFVKESLRATYGDFLIVEVIIDKIHASEKKHGSVLLHLNYTNKTAELLSANDDVQALGTVLKGMGFEIKQSHDGHKRRL